MRKFGKWSTLTKAEKRAKDIVVDYVLECGRHNPTLQPVCTWATELNFDIAKCPLTGENRVWNGCALRYDFLRTEPSIESTSFQKMKKVPSSKVIQIMPRNLASGLDVPFFSF